MTSPRVTGLPTTLARRPLRTIRPRDAATTYAHPRPELARLVDRGVLRRTAPGYYVAVPAENQGRHWLPELEAVAAGIAVSIYGPENAILMGVSAARALGALPRALATAVVAVPKQHRKIELIDRPATVQFVKRETGVIDAERVNTALGPALVTTPEQTILDLARRPGLGDAEIDVPAAIRTLYQRIDHDRLAELAHSQRLVAALRRAENWAGLGR